MNLIPPAAGEGIEYPDSDGKPVAENTKQARWITVLFGNLCALFRESADVFVAMDLFWYAAQGHPEVRTAPDVLAVLGRPKGDRGSYKQWEEAGVPVTVVFEVLFPGNTVPEMADKFAFYEDHGVEEYYIYDPDTNRLQVFVRRGEALVRVRQVDGYVSPRLRIRFDLSGPEMVVLYPDGRRFLTFEEVESERERHARLAAEARAAKAEQRVEDAEQRAENAQRRAENAEQRTEDVRRRAERQADLMRGALRQQATADELQELQRLLEQPPPPV
jgi:Uma2 family endonuclease